MVNDCNPARQIIRQGLERIFSKSFKQIFAAARSVGRIRTLRWRAHWVVGVVALRPLRPRRAGGPESLPAPGGRSCAPLSAARRLAARAVPPRRAIEPIRV